MLEAVQIFTKGGLILFSWSLGLAAVKGNPVDALIRTCLLEERSGETEFAYTTGNTAYTLKWTFHNELGLVFVAVYQRMLQLAYVDNLLEAVKGAFAKRFKMAYPEFEDEFQRMARQAEAAAAAQRAPKAGPKSFDAAKKAAKRNDASGKAAKDDSSGDDVSAGSGVVGGGGGSAGGGGDGGNETASKGGKNGAKGGGDGAGAFDMSEMSRRLRSKKSCGGSGTNLSGKGDAADATPPEKAPAKKTKAKVKRVWSDTKGNAKDLDFSEGAPPEGEEVVKRVDISAPSRVDVEDEESESEEEGEEEGEGQVAQMVGGGGLVAHTKKKKSKNTWLSAVLASSLVRNVVGKSALEREDLEPILEKLKTNFMNKNVAEDIAERLCESVAASLQGRKLASFSSLSSMAGGQLQLRAYLSVLHPASPRLPEPHD